MEWVSSLRGLKQSVKFPPQVSVEEINQDKLIVFFVLARLYLKKKIDTSSIKVLVTAVIRSNHPSTSYTT